MCLKLQDIVFKDFLKSTVSMLCLALFISISGLHAQSCGFSFSKTVAIDHTNVSGTAPHIDFPILFSVTDNNLRTVANGGNVQNANGFDIAFMDQNNVLLAHELMSYNASTGALMAWVKIPILYTEFDTEIKIVYGNSIVTTDPSSTATWESDYEAVLHLQESGNGSDNEYEDATANNHDGTGGGLAGAGSASETPNRVAGKFGFAQDFNDGGSQDLIRLDAVTDASWTAVTVEAWVNPDDNGDDRIFGKSWGTNINDQTWLLRKTGGTGGTRMRTNTNNNGGFDPATLNTGSWQHMAVTWDGATDRLIVYRNGVEVGNTGLNGNTLYTTPTVSQPTIGNTSTQNRGFDGLLQEAKLSKVARSADWLATQFTNQDNPSAFYTVGSELAGTFTPTIPTCGYGFRKTITINNGEVIGSGNHVNFPVLISFTDNDLRTTGNGGDVQNTNGYDIVFTDNNLVPLDHQVETYVATTGELVAWVRVPSLPTGTDYEINMFYGNADVFADPSTFCTWSGNYQSIWHLNDDFLDATSNANDATNSGSADQTASKIADGQTFGTGDYIAVPTTGINTSVGTISIWGNSSSFSGAHQYLFGHTTNPAYANRIQLYTNDAGGNLDLGLGDSHARHTNIFTFNTAQWYYVVLTWDATNYQVYVNGALQASGTYTGLAALNSFADIGNDGNSAGRNEEWFGDLDEVRISNIEIDSSWISTEFNNQNNPGTFYTVSAEITLNATSAQDGDWDDVASWSTGVAPGLGANVVIEDDIDLDHADIRICNLEVNTANDNNSTMRVQNGRTLQVDEEVLLDNNSPGTDDDLTLRVEGGNSKLIVEGDLRMIHTGGDDVFIRANDAGDSMIVRGNMLLEHDGGDNVDLRTNNATSVLLIEGDLTANMNSGAGDIIEYDINAGNFIVNGNLVTKRFNDFGDIEIDMDGGNMTVDSLALYSSGGGGSDQIFVMVDNSSTLTSNRGMYMEMAGGDDHQIDININGGTTGTMRINGDLNIAKTGGDDLLIRVDDDSSLLHVTGNVNITSSGAEEIQIQMDNEATIDIDGDFNITHTEGQLVRIAHEATPDSPTINVDGSMTINMNGGNDNFIVELQSGNLVVDDDLTTNLNPNTGNAWYNLDDATITVGDTMFANHVGDDEFFIELDGASVLNAGTFIGILSGGSTGEELLIDIDDSSRMNVTNDMELELNTGNDLEFHLGQNTTGSTAQLNVGGNLVLDHNGAVGADDIQLFINDDARVNITGNFTMETDGSPAPGNFLTRVWNDAVLTVGGNLVMDNNTGAGYLEIDMDNNGKLEVGGNIVRNASPNNFGLIQSNSTTNTIEYNGTGVQVFADEDGAGTDGIEYEQVIINNTFGTEPQLTMEAPVTLSNSITFTDGVLQTTSGNLLTIADGATTNGGSANSYVSGPVQKEGNDPFIFPLGNGGTWARLGISDLQNGPLVTDQFTATYSLSQHPQGYLDSNDYAGSTGGMFNVSIVEFWTLTRDNGNTQPKVSLYWESGTNSYIDNLADLTVAHLTGPTSWTNEGGTTSGSVAAGNVTTTTNLNSFSPFTFGSTSSVSNPLPIELLKFEAIPVGQTVLLKWVTLSEINNDYFTIERSSNGLDIEEITQLPGAGNSNTYREYSTSDDQPLKGTSYYRLKQTDYDGAYSYSNWVAVSFDREVLPLIAFPNPVPTGNEVHLNQKVSGELVNYRGEKILDIRNSDQFIIPVNTPGFYFLRTNEGEAIKIVVN